MIPNISVIIPTYNRLNKLSQALASIGRIDFDENDYEVIVVDDGSTDGTCEYINDLKKKVPFKLHYLYQKNSGPSSARNNGIRNAVGKYVFIIDSDCVVAKDILKRYVKYFPDDMLGGIGGNVLPEGNDIVSAFLDYTGAWRPVKRNGEFLYLVTANAFFQKKAIEEAGLFDEDFRQPGGEEPELCQRMRDKGYIFKYDPDACVIHSHRTTVLKMIKMFFIQGKGAGLLAMKHPKSWTLNIKMASLTGISAASRFRSDYVRNHKFLKAFQFLLLDYLSTLAYIGGYSFMKRRLHQQTPARKGCSP